ncbi:hypothetical protein [Roseateles puraquae]|uniref:hypothetical protein n=1 Tax=Roseateles puraquae TaxID=431059 RepID=UPI0031DF12DA
MSSIGSIAALNALQSAATREAWQALLQTQVQEAQLQEAQVTPEAPPETAAEAALPATLPLVPSAPASRSAEPLAPVLQATDPGSALHPLTPVLLQPLTLLHGPELRWRATDAPAWRELFDDTGRRPDEEAADDDPPDFAAVQAAAQADPMPAWAQALLARLRRAATTPASASALRPAVQAWCAGQPVLLASPAGLASLQPSRDAAVWQWRRWPAQWRAARPASLERWWAVRLGLGPQGRPRTLRELGASGPTPVAPGQVSCELRLGDVAPGIAHWTAVLVQAPAAPSLRALLATRPSVTWLLCNQTLWPMEGP